MEKEILQKLNEVLDQVNAAPKPLLVIRIPQTLADKLEENIANKAIWDERIQQIRDGGWITFIMSDATAKETQIETMGINIEKSKMELTELISLATEAIEL